MTAFAASRKSLRGRYSAIAAVSDGGGGIPTDSQGKGAEKAFKEDQP